MKLFGSAAKENTWLERVTKEDLSGDGIYQWTREKKTSLRT